MGRLRVTRARMGRGVGYPEEISGPEKGDRKRACGGDPSRTLVFDIVFGGCIAVWWVWSWPFLDPRKLFLERDEINNCALTVPSNRRWEPNFPSIDQLIC